MSASFRAVVSSRAQRGICSVVLALVAACQEPRVLPQQTVDDVRPYHAALVVSDTAPAVGDTVRVALVVRLGADTALASFTSRITFDTLGLRFLDDVSPSDGALRAHHRDSTALRVAGASIAGFTSGTLFRASFRVLQRGALASLRAEFDELHDVSGRDVNRAVRPAAGVSIEGGQQ